MTSTGADNNIHYYATTTGGGTPRSATTTTKTTDTTVQGDAVYRIRSSPASGHNYTVWHFDYINMPKIDTRHKKTKKILRRAFGK